MAINHLPLLLLVLLSCIYQTASLRLTPEKKNYEKECLPFGNLQGIASVCNQDNNAECCEDGKSYPQYSCSPPISTSGTKATLTLNSFEEGGDGGGPSSCTNTYHSNTKLVVALSTGWFNKRSRCGKQIKIIAKNGQSVMATVVDECDSINGCDSVHDFQPPCRTDIVDASIAVWKALGIHFEDGNPVVTWSDT